MNPEDILTALRNADAAGDTAAAQRLAEMYRNAVEVPEGGSIADALGQGLTFGFADEIAGLGGATANQVAKLFGKGTDDSFLDAYKGIRDSARENRDAFRTRNPKTALTAEILGGVATGGVGAARTGVLQGGNRIRNLARAGALEGGIYGLGASDADSVGGLATDTATGALVGSVAGAAIPAVGQRIAKKLRTTGQNLQRTPTQEKINTTIQAGRQKTPEEINRIARDTRATSDRYVDDVKLLRDNDVTLTTGQRTGSTSVKAFETSVDKTFAGGAVDKTFSKQREQFQSKLMEMAGFPKAIAQTGRITDDAIDAGGENLSKKYTEALKGKTVNFGDDFVDDLGRIEYKHNQLLTPQQKREVRTLIDDFLDEAVSSPITGQRYQALRSFVGRRARQFRQSRPELSDLFYDFQRALDDAFVRSTGSSNKALNMQYSHYLQIKNLWRRQGGTKVAQGEIPLASLNTMAKKNPSTDEWRRFINAASAVLGDATANSGTASRAANLMAAGTGFAPTFVVNQALARGVGGSVPEMMGQSLMSAGRSVNQAGNVAGVTAAPGLLPALPADKRREMLGLELRR